MPITIPAKTAKYDEKASITSEKLSKTVKEVLQPHENDSVYKSIKLVEAAGAVKANGQGVFSEVVTAKGIKSEMKALRDLNDAVEKISYVNKNPKQKKYSATEINDAHNVFDLLKERAEKYTKSQYTASQYANDPYLIINTYVDYLQVKYEKEKNVFEQARYDQANAKNYHLVDKDPSKDLINKMEMDSMKEINGRIAEYVGKIKSIENSHPEFKDESNLVYTYANDANIMDPKNIGKQFVISSAAAAASKQFWEKIKSVESTIKVTEAMKKDPQYLKAEAYSQFFSGEQMDSLIAKYLSDPNALLSNQLNEIVLNYHKKGVKKKIVEMRKEYKEFIASDDVRAVKEILDRAVKLGKTRNSWLGASREKDYDSFVSSNASLFLNKDSEGYSKFQKVAASIIAYEAAFGTLKTITSLGDKHVAFDKIKMDRLNLVKELTDKASKKELYSEYVTQNGIKTSAGITQAQLLNQDSINKMGYAKITDLLDSTKTLDISSLSKAEQDEFEKARKKMEAASAANQQIEAADAFSIIKYGNKALLLQFENMLPAKSRMSIKRALVNQFDGIDVTSKDAAEKLEKARASLLTSMLFEGSNTSITGAIKNAFGPSEYRKVKKTLLDAYGNDFAGYTDASWSYVNDSLKKACASLQGITFI
ncbi:MAG: hypothetical protein QW814_01500 [Methanothrix sp.]